MRSNIQTHSSVNIRFLAHDLASPLAVVKLNLEMLNLRGERKVLIKRAFDGLEQIQSRLTREMEAVAQNKLPSWQLNSLIKDVIAFETQSFAGNLIILTVDLKIDKDLTGPKNVFFSICHNLIHNSVEALSEGSPGNRTIRIATYKNSRKQFILEFSDNGPGIPQEKVALLFRKRFTTKVNGHGYGLQAVSRNLAQYFGAGISYHKSGHGGACFRIQF